MNLELLLISAKVIFVFMNVMFIIAQFKRNNSIVDIGWGLGFLSVTIALLVWSGLQTMVQQP